MKFKNNSDKYCFLSDVNRLDLLSEEISVDLYELFIKQRKPIIKGLKNMRKSRLQKAEWIKHRWKYMKGINKFHRSIAGKKMHRAISSFLTTKFFSPRTKTFEDLINNDLTLKAISSLKTHLYIESEYYKSLDEAVEFQEFFEYAIPEMTNIENLLYLKKELNKDQYEFLLRIVDKKQFHKNIANRCNIDIQEIDKNIDEQKTGVNLEVTYSLTLLYETCANCLQK